MPNGGRRAASGASTRMYDDPSTMGKTEANYQPLTPLRFLERSATTFPDHPAYQYGGSVTVSYLQLYDRTRQLASALSQLGVGYGSTVSVMLNNTPQMLESHYGVPMTGGVLHSINTRLDAPTIAYMLEHCEASIVMVDTEFSDVMSAAIDLLVANGAPAPTVIDVVDDVAAADSGVPLIGSRTGSMEYEALVATGEAEASSYEWVETSKTSGRRFHSTTRRGRLVDQRESFITTVGPIC